MLTAGTKLGPYEIVSSLGAGGMGEVYRARDTKLDRDVAIKVLPSRLTDSTSALLRFEREAKAVAALAHPNILSIFDYGNETGVVYAVMELLEGETLSEKLRHGSWLMADGSRDGKSAAIDHKPSAVSHKPYVGLPVRKAVEYGCRSHAGSRRRTTAASSIAI